jgi:hypothetical protein
VGSRAQISIPNNVNLRCIAWSHSDGYIGAGGDDGLLKVLKLDAPKTDAAVKDGAKAAQLAVPTNLQINQNLEGHSGWVV